MNDNDVLYTIALSRIPLVGHVTAKTLVSYCGSPRAVFEARQKELLKIPGIGAQTAQSISEGSALVAAEEELAFLEKHDMQAISYLDSAYPVRLKQNQDSPVVLFFKGSNVDLFNHERIVAIVGTRTPSEQGRLLCEDFVTGLKKYDVLVVSGLAFGIDGIAHRRATQEGIPNIGVLGHGLGRIYPHEHLNLAQRMVEHGGVLSEFKHDAKPDRENFPMRNRIIAGMCDALVVVESANKGGSMISANLAFDYGREVFAFPGRVKDSKSSGCNYLIKNNKASLIENVEDLAQQLNWSESGRKRTIQTLLFHDLNETEQLIIDVIRKKPNIPIDELTYETKLHPGILASETLNLEFKGLVRTLPGKRYILV